MPKYFSLPLLFLIFYHNPLISNDNNRLPNGRRLIEAKKIDEQIIIDGRLNEVAWDGAMVANSFTQFEPYNGSQPTFNTEVKVLFDDNAIYVGATLYDDDPGKIFRELGQRDNSDMLKADAFSVLISPYNDGINYFEFLVSASGVQTDMRYTGTTTDRSWNDAWHSKVLITEFGWVVEMKIPFSALRFSKRTVENWGINFRRLIKRYNEWSSWNPMDNSILGIVNQSGELAGIRDIVPPVRLSFSPYIATYLNKFPDSKSFSPQINGGLDLKYGISESFTLDVTLIPDFGQVKSDEKILNISPYEVQYEEQRPFFTEGMDLFMKGGIFYSRRVGSLPKGYMIPLDELNENEIVTENPLENKMINATKLSGRTGKGLGIGLFNAMTSNTHATIRDTISNSERQYLTQAFTNYNVIVFDQTLRNNSFVSLVNTNLITPNQQYMANVTATEFVLNNKSYSHALYGNGAVSQIDNNTGRYGYKHFLSFAKVSGNLLYSVSSNTESKNYNPNDMGYLKKHNVVNNECGIGYWVYEPFWRLLNLNTWLGLSYNTLHDPRVYTSSSLHFNLMTTFAKRFHFVLMDLMVDPAEMHDFDEPRVDGRMVIRPRKFSGNLVSSTDYRRTLAFDTGIGYTIGEKMGYSGIQINFSPRVRVSNNMFLVYLVVKESIHNDIGYVSHSTDNLTVYMGMRDVSTLTNTLSLLYSFNEKSFINLSGRHYWRWVDYNSYHQLNDDGTLSAPLTNYTNSRDINYNLFNIDLTYQWNFAPNSMLSIVWKNAIEAFNTNVRSNFHDNWKNILESDAVNSISFKILYYLDYHTVMKSRKKA